MRFIDGHAHIGYTGGWADVGINEEQLIAQMDQYNIKKQLSVMKITKLYWI